MIIINGLHKDNSKIISVYDRGFTYGDGVFTTCLIKNGIIDDWKLHYDRIKRHASHINLSPPADEFIQSSLQNLLESIKKNNYYSLRLIFSRGESARGLNIPASVQTQFFIIIDEIEPPQTTPLKIIISEKVRRNEFSPLSNIKSLNYLDNIIAKNEAITDGADDAIMLSTSGNVSCATSSNLFIREGNLWITPRTEDGALDGIERYKKILSGAIEDRITTERLHKADEIILTNSLWKNRQGILI